MEKIYEVKNHNRKDRKQIKIDGTTILSFAVALFAIVSLVTVGFNQISYAALSDVQMPVGDSFLVNDYTSGDDSERIKGSTSTFYVYPYYALIDKKDESGNVVKDGDGNPIIEKFPVYCLERDIDFTSNGWYSQEPNVVLDGGLLYLLANLYPNAEIHDASDQKIDNAASTWVTQTAIWIYMAEKNIGENKTMTAEIIKSIREETTLVQGGDDLASQKELITATAGKYLYDDLFVYPEGKAMSINQLIAQAKQLPAVATDLTVNNGEQIKITNVSNDNKYYFSEVIKVREHISHKTIGEFKGFSISIDEAPEGTVITDKNGNPLDEKALTNIKAGTELYVRVPINKITEENKVATFTARGYFDSFVGYGYRAKTLGSATGTAVTGESQRITIVDKVDNTHVKQFKINLDYVPEVPDTGMSTAQSIYFIGLVVLLCGIGIVYANTKPATNKQ